MQQRIRLSAATKSDKPPSVTGSNRRVPRLTLSLFRPHSCLERVACCTISPNLRPRRSSPWNQPLLLLRRPWSRVPLGTRADRLHCPIHPPQTQSRSESSLCLCHRVNNCPNSRFQRASTKARQRLYSMQVSIHLSEGASAAPAVITVNPPTKTTLRRTWRRKQTVPSRSTAREIHPKSSPSQRAHYLSQ